jgi:hypothetical protein
VNDYQLNARYIDYWGPVCPTGRHAPPHPGDTCEDIDQWIALRDRLIAEQVLTAWRDFEREYRELHLADTVFTGPTEPAPGLPTKREVDLALDILRPHLAWDHRYRP